jgi:transcriptional regulator with XRE-family HTH domain
VDIKDFINQAIAGELRAEQNKRKLSQAELSKRSGIPIATMQRLLTGKYDIRAEALVAVATAIGADPADVMRDAVKYAEQLLSEVTDNVTAFPGLNADDTGEIDTYAGAKAAYRDPEADTDET